MINIHNTYIKYIHIDIQYVYVTCITHLYDPIPWSTKKKKGHENKGIRRNPLGFLRPPCKDAEGLLRRGTQSQTPLWWWEDLVEPISHWTDKRWVQLHTYWVVATQIFLEFSPRKLWRWSNLTSICFEWVGSTTNWHMWIL